MMSNREKKLLNKIKSNAFKLKQNGQIPINLYRMIIGLNYESDISDVIKLKDLANEYTRVARYYFLHPEKQKDCDDDLRELGCDLD